MQYYGFQKVSKKPYPAYAHQDFVKSKPELLKNIVRLKTPKKPLHEKSEETPPTTPSKSENSTPNQPSKFKSENESKTNSSISSPDVADPKTQPTSPSQSNETSPTPSDDSKDKQEILKLKETLQKLEEDNKRMRNFISKLRQNEIVWPTLVMQDVELLSELPLDILLEIFDFGEDFNH